MPKAQSAIQFGAQGNAGNNQKQQPSPKKQAVKANVQKRKETKPKPLQSHNESIDPLAKLEAAKWKQTTDATTGRTYWYHKETKQTTWDTPPAVAKVLAAESAVQGIGATTDIEAAWEQESESDYTTSGSYYDDGSVSEESETEDDHKNQYYQQQPQQMGGNQNGYHQQQWGNNNGYNPQQQWGNNNGYNPAMNNQGQWGNNNGYNSPQMNPQQMNPQMNQAHGGYPQQNPYRPKNKIVHDKCISNQLRVILVIMHNIARRNQLKIIHGYPKRSKIESDCT